MATTYIDATELARLERMCGEAHKQAGERMVSESDFDDAAFMARTKDADGETPLNADGTANTDYTNTVDLYKAASIVWHQKAGVYAEQFAFSSDGSSFQRNQGYHMCLNEAKRYADMASGWTPVEPTERA